MVREHFLPVYMGLCTLYFNNSKSSGVDIIIGRAKIKKEAGKGLERVKKTSTYVLERNGYTNYFVVCGLFRSGLYLFGEVFFDGF